MPSTPQIVIPSARFLGARNLLFLKLNQKQIPRFARNDNPGESGVMPGPSHRTLLAQTAIIANC